MAVLFVNKKQLTEQEIRTRYITPAIKASNWMDTQIREEYTITAGRIVAQGGAYKREKGKRADYVLFYKSHIPLAIVEAKDNNHTVSDGMQQALKYAQMLNVPFVFSSNGDAFSFHNRMDVKGEKEQQIALDKFPSCAALWEMYKTNSNLSTHEEQVMMQPYYTERANRIPRYYQTNAINLTVDAIAKGQNRILLVMATGTGKTYTAFQIIWRLWKGGQKKRILFLADRNALIDQTYTNDFSPFKDKMTIIRNRKIDTSYEIYLALYQGLTGEDHKQTFMEFSPNFFDLIIVDECHRGSAKADSAWREILTYFSSAAQIGLTATPISTKEASNAAYFGDPVYIYSLKQGIDDGFLAPYRVIRVLFDNDAEGFRPYMGQTDDNGDIIDDRIYGRTDFDRELVLSQRTKMVAKVVSNYMKKHNLRNNKSIFFCVDTEHANRMRMALVNENTDMVQQDERYIMRITGDDNEGKMQLDNFRDVESKYPVMVTTSKLLSTGVDVQMVKIIVLDANINSMTEFKQIIGRGTRVREDLGKMFFTIFDFRDATRLFADPAFDGEYIIGEGFMPDDDGNITESPDDVVYEPDPDGISEPDGEHQKPERRTKIYVSGVECTILNERIQFINDNGELVTESLKDFTRKNILIQYRTLKDFLKVWHSAKRKKAIIDELANQGILIDELQDQIGHEFDPFDLICHIAFDQKPLTRYERSNNVKKRNYFAKYGEQARAVLNALLDKYTDTGINNLEDLAILKVQPITEFGSPAHIINHIFKGKSDFEHALRELEKVLYEEVLNKVA